MAVDVVLASLRRQGGDQLEEDEQTEDRDSGRDREREVYPDGPLQRLYRDRRGVRGEADFLCHTVTPTDEDLKLSQTSDRRRAHV